MLCEFGVVLGCCMPLRFSCAKTLWSACLARQSWLSPDICPTSVTACGPFHMSAPAIRIGEGWDTHALVTGRPLILGGVAIPHTHGLLGHSDADALLHAITDALLGAAGLGDIGRHFPDTDARFKGADSVVLLQEAHRRVNEAGWGVVNLDATIVAQAPKMAPHIGAMRQRCAPTPIAGAEVAATFPSTATGRQKEKRKTRPKAIVVRKPEIRTEAASHQAPISMDALTSSAFGQNPIVNFLDSLTKQPFIIG